MNQESYFGFEEMFISTTDQHGIIQSGNDVFVRVSGFEKEKLLNSPHNIIRHPDMPKTVFRLMWKEIQNGNIICAYVKNRSIDGKHYWVFATVLPKDDGYYSTRIKPSSKFFELVPQLYARLLQHEKANGMDSAETFLMDQLKGLGFESYAHFMKEALYEELNSRDEKIASQAGARKDHSHLVDCNRTLLEMGALADRSRKATAVLFGEFKGFSEVQSGFDGVSSVILKTCDQLENLSLNMSVMANKLGKEGPSLSMIALAFQKSSRDISSRFSKFGVNVDQIRKTSAEMRFSVCVSRLLIEMMYFFIHETKSKSSDSKVLTEFMRDFQMLISGVKQTLEWVSQSQVTGIQDLKDFVQMTTNLRNQVMSLDLIRMGGKLEGSRTARTEEVFIPYVNQIVKHIQSIEVPVLKVAGSAEQMVELYQSVKHHLEEVSAQILMLEMIRYREHQIIAQLEEVA
jgi:PAS domain S-box-containing protein